MLDEPLGLLQARKPLAQKLRKQKAKAFSGATFVKRN
jgi:hypothetical protein